MELLPMPLPLDLSKRRRTDAIPEAVRLEVINSIPVRRMGDPMDIANAYLFLASEESGFVNGQVLGVNGGQAS